MKLLLITALILSSCGKRIETVENAYNDDAIKSKQVLQDAKLSALEARLDVLNSKFDEAVIDFSTSLNNVQSESKNLSNSNYMLLMHAFTELAGTQLQPIKICNSNEHLLKNSSGVYAVYMVSNNYGTFLGKLAQEVTYQTTDSVHATFKITNNQLVCL